MALMVFILTVLVCLGINKALGAKPLDNGVWFIILLSAYFCVEIINRGAYGW